MRRWASRSNDIDYVMCTHLHTDHVGWNTKLENGRWVPTFPKAKYIMADRELEHWTARQKDNPDSVPWITNSVLPIIAAKRAQIVKSDFVFNEQVQFIPTPGHTIDHFSVLVGRAGADALITGDMIYSPLQGKYPELGMMADYDSPQAGKTRRKVFDRFCEEPTDHVRDPFSGALDRPGAALGRRLQIRRRGRLKCRSAKYPHRCARIIKLVQQKSTPGATELGSCLTDATRGGRARRTVRVFAAMLRSERATQQSSRPFDPVVSLRPPCPTRVH